MNIHDLSSTLSLTALLYGYLILDNYDDVTGTSNFIYKFDQIAPIAGV
jgi:hypothetical protein